MKNDPDFYIGWQDKASPLFAGPIRWVVIGLFVFVPLLAALLVWQQRGFSNATFDYGRLTTIEGQLIRQPVPFLRVSVRGSTPANPLYERILLLGLGKHGADSTLHQWETTHGSLAGRTLKIRGTLLYHEGRAALELTNETDALLRVSTPGNQPEAPVVQPVGQVTLQGEITDPKCFLGVMKPGDGRPHRSCAVRCIAGGIPPLLYVNDGLGRHNGYVLVGAHGESINGQLLAYVGKNVQVRGRLQRADNWLLLYIDAPVEEVLPSMIPTFAARPLPDVDHHIAMCQ